MDAPALPALSPASPRLRALRRAVHVSFSLSLLYYLVPDPLPLVVLPKAHAALGLALLVTLAEALRLSRGWSLSLMRDYERRQPAAYYWLGLGCCLALVFFPPRFAVLTILGVCFADPVIALSRQTSYKAHAPALGALAWLAVGGAAVVVGGLNVPWWLLLGGAGAAVLAEGRRVPYVDDDFLMNTVPLVLLTLWASALGV
ncbi:MAG TPA: hypothetical protein VJ547_01020 [Candidatus Thermoplasmatota archaeon]|nr:hypothetical protein [Candidatus Thermoplasmatota archaeon]